MSATRSSRICVLVQELSCVTCSAVLGKPSMTSPAPSATSGSNMTSSSASPTCSRPDASKTAHTPGSRRSSACEVLLQPAGADTSSLHSNGWRRIMVSTECPCDSSMVRLRLRTTCIRGAVGRHHGIRDELALVHEILDLGVALQQGGHGLRALQAPALQNEGRVGPFALQEGPM